MFAVVMLSSTVCACSAQKDETSMEEPAKMIHYDPHGHYNLKDYNVDVYSLQEPNDYYQVVAFDEEANHVMVIHNEGQEGTSYWSGVYKEGSFKGLTPNYVLFEQSNGAITAVSIKDRADCKVGEYEYEVRSFEELPNDELNTVAWTIGKEKVQF